MLIGIIGCECLRCEPSFHSRTYWGILLVIVVFGIIIGIYVYVRKSKRRRRSRERNRDMESGVKPRATPVYSLVPNRPEAHPMKAMHSSGS